MENGRLYEDLSGKCLDEIIESRYHTTMHFPEDQVVGLMESLVYSLAYLCKKSVANRDFYPTNIFYSEGTFKVRNPLALTCSAYAITQQRTPCVQLRQKIQFPVAIANPVNSS